MAEYDSQTASLPASRPAGRQAGGQHSCYRNPPSPATLAAGGTSAAQHGRASEAQARSCAVCSNESKQREAPQVRVKGSRLPRQRLLTWPCCSPSSPFLSPAGAAGTGRPLVECGGRVAKGVGNVNNCICHQQRQGLGQGLVAWHCPAAPLSPLEPRWRRGPGKEQLPPAAWLVAECSL